ncbi:Uncharacterized protein FWK35_00030053 [Aphis craccivora]|uniref:Uncharacterized protein n=1 Tax=Aphis craccivora TaxID=307492 RepID=A0A6G0VW95_APHCR|nr:Uncharacterized protein FWK35_00030053 [Aphis craccivora]
MGKRCSRWPRIKMDTAIGRIYTIHPNQSECFHLRLLLNYVQGPTSFESLKAFDGFSANRLNLNLCGNSSEMIFVKIFFIQSALD